MRQKPSCLWCGKNLLACGTVKTSLPVVRQKPSCLWCGKAFLPVVRLRQKLSCLWCGLRHEPPLRISPLELKSSGLHLTHIYTERELQLYWKPKFSVCLHQLSQADHLMIKVARSQISSNSLSRRETFAFTFFFTFHGPKFDQHLIIVDVSTTLVQMGPRLLQSLGPRSSKYSMLFQYHT